MGHPVKGGARKMPPRNPLPSEVPGDFPSSRWDQLGRDVADFRASPWLAEASRLGWTDLDLFGVDAVRPMPGSTGSAWCRR
jgi:hypothetical protein